MRFWNVIGALTRYVLAAVACISVAQFLLLLNVGTENAGRLAGQSLARGVISGLVAAVWFYRARKGRTPALANVPTQVRATAVPKSLEQPAVPPMDSAPSTSPASVLTPDHSGSSFEQKELKSVIVVVAVGIVLFILVGAGIFHQPWTLSTGASQPRFIHVQGAPSWQMFDNRTGQTCVSTPSTYDSFVKVREDFRAMLQKPVDDKPPLPEDLISAAVNSLDSTDPTDRLLIPQFQEFYKRWDALKIDPNKPPAYHYEGMPYCKEL